MQFNHYKFCNIKVNVIIILLNYRISGNLPYYFLNSLYTEFPNVNVVFKDSQKWTEIGTVRSGKKTLQKEPF